MSVRKNLAAAGIAACAGLTCLPATHAHAQASPGGQGGGATMPSGAAPAQQAGTFGMLKGKIDFWSYYQENADGTNTFKETARMQQPFQLPDNWRMTLRADLPLMYTDKQGPANRTRDWEWGWGDPLAQVSFSTPKITENISLGFGARIVVPVGDDSPYGGSQWKWAPQFSLSYDAKDITPGLTFDPMVRYIKGFSPTRGGITTTREYDFYPTATYKFGDGWAVSLWNENPIILNDRTDKWFVPLDGMIWKTLSPSWELGFGAATKLVDDDPNYKNMVYGRITAFF